MRHRRLYSKRLYYRRFQQKDLDDLYSLMGNPAVCKYLPGPESYSLEQTQKWLTGFRRHFTEKIPSFAYAMFDRTTNKFIGYCGCMYVHEYKENEVMYAVKEEYWGKGYATEAAFKMLELAKRLNISKMIAFTEVNNENSEKIIRKLGYHYVKEVDLWGERLKYYELYLKKSE